MATKTEIPITSEKEDTENKMAVVKQRTGTRVEADINNSLSTKSHLKIMIMNTGGKNVGDKPTDRRKRAIYDVVTNTRAALVLFQEFSWTSIRGSAWQGYNWPKHLQYTGHTDASILFDINEVTLEEYPQKWLDDTLRDLIRMGDIKHGFTPIPRMCLRKIKTKGVPIVEFICVSWHGRHNKAKLEDLKEEFKSMLKYILKLSEKESLQCIVAGDYNVIIKNIETLVPPSLVLHKYKPTERREPENIIDFFITSESLVMSDINALTLKSETDVMGVLSLFDHDPVVSSMSTKTDTEYLYRRNHNRDGQPGGQYVARRQGGSGNNKHCQPEYQSGARRQPGNRHEKLGQPEGQFGVCHQPDIRHNRDGQPGGQYVARRQAGSGNNKHCQPEYQSGARRQPGNRHDKLGQPEGQFGACHQPDIGHNRDGQPGGQYVARRQPGNGHNKHGQPEYQSWASRQPGNRHDKHGQPEGQFGACHQPDIGHNRDGQPGGQYVARRQPGIGHNKHCQPEYQSGDRRQPGNRHDKHGQHVRYT